MATFGRRDESMRAVPRACGGVFVDFRKSSLRRRSSPYQPATRTGFSRVEYGTRAWSALMRSEATEFNLDLRATLRSSRPRNGHFRCPDIPKPDRAEARAAFEEAPSYEIA